MKSVCHAAPSLTFNAPVLIAIGWDFTYKSRLTSCRLEVGAEAAASDAAAPDASTAAQPQATGSKPPAKWNEAGATCISCGIGIGSAGFLTPEEQRAHFKTDWHRNNVRRRLDKRPPLSEAEFEKLVEDDAAMSSISGSSLTGSSALDSDAGSALDGGNNDGDEDVGAGPRMPQAAFRAPDGRAFCVWRCLLTRDTQRSAVPGALLGAP